MASCKFRRIQNILQHNGPGSSVGIATELPGWTVGGSNPSGARFSARPDRPWGLHPASCTMGTGSFPGVKSGRGVTLTTHPLLVPRSWKSRAIPLPTLRACNGNILPLPTTDCIPPSSSRLSQAKHPSNSWLNIKLLLLRLPLLLFYYLQLVVRESSQLFL